MSRRKCSAGWLVFLRSEVTLGSLVKGCLPPFEWFATTLASAVDSGVSSAPDLVGATRQSFATPSASVGPRESPSSASPGGVALNGGRRSRSDVVEESVLRRPIRERTTDHPLPSTSPAYPCAGTSCACWSDGEPEEGVGEAHRPFVDRKRVTSCRWRFHARAKDTDAGVRRDRPLDTAGAVPNVTCLLCHMGSRAPARSAQVRASREKR